MEKLTLKSLFLHHIWDYKNVDTSSIQRAIENFNWQYAFESKNINPLQHGIAYL